MVEIEDKAGNLKNQKDKIDQLLELTRKESAAVPGALALVEKQGARLRAVAGPTPPAILGPNPAQASLGLRPALSDSSPRPVNCYPPGKGQDEAGGFGSGPPKPPIIDGVEASPEQLALDPRPPVGDDPAAPRGDPDGLCSLRA